MEVIMASGVFVKEHITEHDPFSPLALLLFFPILK